LITGLVLIESLPASLFVVSASALGIDAHNKRVAQQINRPDFESAFTVKIQTNLNYSYIYLHCVK
jgi:hypothetical protein